MAKKYNQGVSVSNVRFTQAPMGEVEYSKMYGQPTHTTTFNAGQIIPIYCNEVLPHDTWGMEVEEIIRQTTLKVPSMDRAVIDLFAYFVPNRIVNKSWKNVMGENTSGAWIAPKVSLAPLVGNTGTGNIQVPVGSVADYYGYPTQQGIPRAVLQSCHDLKFRGYLEIYNNYFRDQNYQPPIPYSKLNVYNGFFESVGTGAGYAGSGSINLNTSYSADGSYGQGAIAKELYGSGDVKYNPPSSAQTLYPRPVQWSALTAPLRANKLHDYFTSVLPSPQKGEEVIISLGESAPVVLNTYDVDEGFENYDYPLYLKSATQLTTPGLYNVGFRSSGPNTFKGELTTKTSLGSEVANEYSYFNGSNLYGTADLSQASGISIADLRMSAAVQQVYEILGRGGSRYTEYINSFFELDIDNPFDDIPTCLGHIRRDLELYQTAQTSATTEDSAQGSLSAFGYTSTGGKLFTRTFLEHGYIHVMAVVRHRNIYPALLSRDNFRLEMMDFYQYPLANISEQPVYTREINPFAGNDQVFGYQEAWSEYRMEPDRVSGLIRTGVPLSLSYWSYVDDFDGSLLIADGDWLESNTESVIARGTASTDEDAPQFKGKFIFKITKERPMPTYSMSGMDIL